MNLHCNKSLHDIESISATQDTNKAGLAVNIRAVNNPSERNKLKLSSLASINTIAKQVKIWVPEEQKQH